MLISTKDWNRYINRLNAINTKAADMMREYIQKNGYDDTDALIRVANAISTKYGEAAAAATCDMYDAIAEAQGVDAPAAEPARTPSMKETENVIRSALKRAPSTLPDETGKLVKKTGTRTMRKNAARDNAKMALIPGGDGCAFCRMLASRGWESARNSKSFEAHLHKNCKCEYVVRFNDDLNVEGYDPEAIYQEFMDLGGNNWDERVNLMRQKYYAEHAEEIRAQKRDSYERKKEVLYFQSGGRLSGGHYYKSSDIEGERGKRADEAYERYSREDDSELIAKNTGFSVEDIQKIRSHIFF